MKMKRIVSAVILLLSVNLSFGQGVLSIKNYPGAQIIINNQVANPISNDLKLSFDSPDTVLLEIRKDKYSTKKIISLTESRSYEVVKSGKDNYKIRLRTNVVLKDAVEVSMNSMVEQENLEPTLLKELEQQEYEFDKVNVLCVYLRKHKESNENLSLYLSALSHDFSKWQVVEIVHKENLMELDYETISASFDSETYKDQLISLLKEE